MKMLDLSLSVPRQRSVDNNVCDLVRRFVRNYRQYSHEEQMLLGQDLERRFKIQLTHLCKRIAQELGRPLVWHEMKYIATALRKWVFEHEPLEG